MDYWDRLEKIVGLARLLQRCPIPDDETEQQINLMHLGYVEHDLRAMLNKIAPKVELWVGDAEQCPTGMILGSEWNQLMK